MKNVNKTTEEPIEDSIEELREGLQEETKIPIVDKKSYDSYIKYSKKPILNSKSKYKVSTGAIINLKAPKIQLVEKISDLPDSEQSLILKLKKVHDSTHSKANVYKRKAYGLTTTPKRNSSLLDFRKTEVIELFGRMFTTREVHEIINKEWNVEISIDCINRFRVTNLDAINIKIEEFKASYSDIRLGVKRSRLEELSWIYKTRKHIYNDSFLQKDHELLLKTLEQIRKEVEIDKIIIEGNVKLSIEQTVNLHIKTELAKTLPIKEIILSRVAAKSNIDPKILLKSINDSYYSNVSGVLNEPEDAEFEEIVFPSTQVYDFDKIERINKQKKQKESLKKETTLQVEEVNEASKIKNSLLEKIREKTQKLNKADTFIESMEIERRDI